jgi:UDP-glucuronate 4-epimerase
MDYFTALENALGIVANKEFLPMQPGDVYQTCADFDDLMRGFDFKPSTPIGWGSLWSGIGSIMGCK